MYLAHTRPSLANALSKGSQCMHNPGEQHMNFAMHILRYLKSALGRGILFKKNSNCESVDNTMRLIRQAPYMIGDLRQDTLLL